MPFVDWTRTDLDFLMSDGSTGLRFEKSAFAAFDLFILKRTGAEKDYSLEERKAAKERLEQMDDAEITKITQNVMGGLSGGMTESVANLDIYKDMDAKRLQSHLICFLKEIIPVAEEFAFSFIWIAESSEDRRRLKTIIKTVDSPYNSLCFCTGSFGVRADNDLPQIIQNFGHRINFVYLRATKRDVHGNFHEVNHLEGGVDMYAVVKELVKIQQTQQLLKYYKIRK